MEWNRDRHLAEWRSLLFTVIVTVNPKIWNVNVIGIATPPFGDVAEPPFFAWQRLTLAGKYILQKQTIFVNEKNISSRAHLHHRMMVSKCALGFSYFSIV